MDNCGHSPCTKKAVFLASFCWKHMDEADKAAYSKRLLDYLDKVKTIEHQNFRKVVFRDVRFPEYVAFGGCNFRSAQFHGCVLQRVCFQGCNFTAATLEDCHCQYSDFRGRTTKLRGTDARGTDFSGALLQNVDFRGADLRDAILVDADMIGAMLSGVKLYAARLLNTRIRKENFCNFDRKSGREISVGDERSRERGGETASPLQARYVYSSLKNNFRSIGEYGDERWARAKEREMERKRLFRLWCHGDRNSDALALERWSPVDSGKLFESRWMAALNWGRRWFLTILGYGETPWVFLALSAVVIVVCSFLLLFFGFQYGKTTIQREWAFAPSDFGPTLHDFGLSLYFSVVTFTTLGYGDAIPTDATRAIVAVEALCGFFFYSALVATFLKRLSDQ